MQRNLLPLFLALMTVSCGFADYGKTPLQDSTEPSPVATGKPRPGSYLGDLPCASCEGIRYRLDLFEDYVFFLRMEYLGQTENQSHDDIGRWSVNSDGRTITLVGGREAPLFFRISKGDALEKLDLEGQTIISDLNYDLHFSAGLPPLEPHLFMHGMYRYMADAALFSECLTGRQMAVTFEGDNIALERAYLDARDTPGEALLTSVEGRIAQRPAMEGDRTIPTLIVDRFIGIWPADTCDRRPTSHDIDSSTQAAPGRPQ